MRSSSVGHRTYQVEEKDGVLKGSNADVGTRLKDVDTHIGSL